MTIADRAEPWELVLPQMRLWLQRIAEQELDRILSAKLSPSDLVQQTLLEATRDLDQFRGLTEAELAAWLKQTLLNNAHDLAARYYRADKRDVRREVPFHAKDAQGLSHWRGMASPGPSPSSIHRRNERDEQLEIAIAQLNAKYQEVLLLRHERDFSFPQIGVHLGISADAARKLWVRAIQSLKRTLDQIDGFSA